VERGKELHHPGRMYLTRSRSYSWSRWLDSKVADLIQESKTSR
jgi:hypothetical protein